MSVFGVILVRISLAFSRIRTEYGEILVRTRENAGNMRTRITRNTDTFYAVFVRHFLMPRRLTEPWMLLECLWIRINLISITILKSRIIEAIKNDIKKPVIWVELITFKVSDEPIVLQIHLHWEICCFGTHFIHKLVKLRFSVKTTSRPAFPEVL